MNIETATSAQLAVINSEALRLLVIAGPGSGKSSTIVARIKRLVDSGVPASEICAISFTNAAAGELRERIGFDLGHLGTIHSLCGRLLKEHGGFMGYGPRLSVISPESASDLLASKAASMGSKTPLKALIALKSNGRPARGHRLSVDETVIASYFDDLKASGIVEFDILLTETVELLKSRAFSPWKYLFVDEVQDSSEVDWRIFKGLPIANKCFVGDPDQAIYSFRGGNVELMQRVAADPGTTVIKLEANFRSHAEICEAAQKLIEHNAGRIRKETASVKGVGGTVDVLDQAITEGEEIGAVARRIDDLIASYEYSEGEEPTEIAILARTNAIAYVFRKSLVAAGLPVTMREPSTLPLDWAFARSFVELLGNPENDTLAFFFLVAMYQKKGASAKEAREAAHAAKNAAASVGKSLNMANIGLMPHQTIRVADVAAYLSHFGISWESRMVIAEKIKELPSSATVTDLALALATVRDSTKSGAEGGIEVLTIHGAKGREWDTVFIVGFEDEVIPGRRANVEEERRLAYVAMTRARKSLFISSSKSRQTQWGGLESHNPSRFIKEIGT